MSAVRALIPSDAPAYAALRREALGDSPWAFARSPQDDPASDPAVVARRLAEPEAATIGAFEGDGGRLLASASINRGTLLKARHRAAITGVYVTPAARGRGLGRAVVLGCVEAARSWPGVDIVWLSVSERSLAAQRLYESLGFIVWGREPDALRIDGRAHDEVHMQRRIR